MRPFHSRARVWRGPQALDGSSDTFKARRTGKATFSFPTLDEEMATELEAFLQRLHQPYRAHHVDRAAI